MNLERTRIHFKDVFATATVVVSFGICFGKIVCFFTFKNSGGMGGGKGNTMYC